MGLKFSALKHVRTCATVPTIHTLFLRLLTAGTTLPGFPIRKVQLLSAYLGSHVHEVVQHQGRRLRGAPATAFQPLRSCHLSLAVLGIVLGAAGAGPREEQPAVHQLDVVQPGQQVGEHDLTPVGMRGGEALADLCRERQRPRVTSSHQTEPKDEQLVEAVHSSGQNRNQKDICPDPSWSTY